MHISKGPLAAVLLISGGTWLGGCDRPATTAPADALVPETAASARGGAKKLDIERCAFGQTFALDSSNPFYPLTVGSTWYLRGEEDGATLELRTSVLDETVDVGGVTTRVVEEVEWEDGELVEISRNFVAATPDGTICYFGEDVDDYEDGEIVSSGGEWRADEPGNYPGILFPASPRPGTRFQMEGAPGVAEDMGKIVGSGPVTVPAGRFTDTVRILERNPLDGDFDFKVYAGGVGIVIDGPLELVSYTVAPAS